MFSILNLQDKVNGIENIKRICKGKVCIDWDIDEKYYFGKQKIDRYIKYVITELGSRKGGLMLTAEIGPDVPLENAEVVLVAFEKCCKLHLELP